MVKKYQGDKPAATPVMGKFENYIADKYGEATMACIREGKEMGLETRQIQQIMLFALRQLGKQASSIIGIMTAAISREAKIKVAGMKKVPVDPKTLKPKK